MNIVYRKNSMQGAILKFRQNLTNKMGEHHYIKYRKTQKEVTLYIEDH